jgi:hypothetical protein
MWEADHTVAASAFALDTTLDTATFTDTLRGLRLTVKATGYGATRRQAGQNGNLLVEARDAKGDVRWGADHYVDPPHTQIPTDLFRRLNAIASRR